MLLSLNRNLKNILLYAISIAAIFLLFKFVIFAVPIAIVGWGTYKLVGFSRQKLHDIKISRISRVNRENINRAFINREYEQIFRPTEFEKNSTVIDVEYEEIKR